MESDGEGLSAPERRVVALLEEMTRTADSIEWVPLITGAASGRGSAVRGQWGRRRTAVLAVAAVLLLLAAVIAPLEITHARRETPSTTSPPGDRGGRSGRVVVPFRRGEGAAFLAVHGSILYVASDDAGNPPYALSAYRLPAGRLIRRVTVPSMPAALAISAQGEVWLSFYADQNPGPSGIWLLTPTLSERSSLWNTTATAILPAGGDTALAPWDRGLQLIRMPPPGASGAGRVRDEPGSTLGNPSDTAPTAAVRLDGRVVVEATNGAGLDSHLVVAGHPALRFPTRGEAGDPAVTDGELWDPLFLTAASARLVELNAELRVVTPRWIGAERLLRSVSFVAGHDGTLVAGSATAHRLVCVVPLRRHRIATIDLPGVPAVLALSGEGVYVADSLPTALATTGVRFFRLPPECRP